MVEELANEYAQYLRRADISNEVTPIIGSIDQMLNRLDEFESLMITVKHDAALTTEQQVPTLLGRQHEFDKLCSQIDDLERFVALVEHNLNTVEEHVVTAEEELGINALGLRGLLMPILAGIHKKESTANVRQRREPYQPPEVFQTETYFSQGQREESTYAVDASATIKDSHDEIKAAK